jgi:hypothetical protein
VEGHALPLCLSTATRGHWRRGPRDALVPWRGVRAVLAAVLGAWATLGAAGGMSGAGPLLGGPWEGMGHRHTAGSLVRGQGEDRQLGSCARSANYSWVWRLHPYAQAEEAETPNRFSDNEASSAGCLVGGGGLFAAGYLAGPSEAIMLWGGGLLAPSGSLVLAVSLLGGLGAAGCSFGATVAPTVAWAYEQSQRIFAASQR